MQFDAKDLKYRLHYDVNTGLIYWKYQEDMPDNYNARWENRPALTTKAANGMLYGKFKGHNLFAHRAAFALLHDEYRNDIYHWDGDKTQHNQYNLRARGYRDTFGFPRYFLDYIPEQHRALLLTHRGSFTARAA